MSTNNVSSKPDLGSSLYEGAADFGILKSKIMYYVAIGLAIVLVLVGIKLYSTDQSDLVDTSATVLEVLDKQTMTYTDPKTKAITQSFVYSLNIKFVADSVQEEKPEIKKTITYKSNSPIVVGQSVLVTYSKSNPQIVTEPIMRAKTLALILSGIGAIVLIGAGVTYWLSRRSKFFAAAQGVGTLSSIVSAPFRN